MKTKADATIHDGGMIERATITVDGRDFTACGAMVSETLIVCYPAVAAHPHSITGGNVIEFRTWDGQVIATGKRTGYSRGFHGARLTHYSMSYAGHRWHGKGSGEGMILRMHRGAKLS